MAACPGSTRNAVESKAPCALILISDVLAARPIDGRLVKEVQVDDETVEAVPEFCYLGDMLSAGGGCELAAVARCKSAWGKFRQLLSLLTNRNLPLLTRGYTLFMMFLLV